MFSRSQPSPSQPLAITSTVVLNIHPQPFVLTHVSSCRKVPPWETAGPGAVLLLLSWHCLIIFLYTQGEIAVPVLAFSKFDCYSGGQLTFLRSANRGSGEWPHTVAASWSLSCCSLWSAAIHSLCVNLLRRYKKMDVSAWHNQISFAVESHCRMLVWAQRHRGRRHKDSGRGLAVTSQPVWRSQCNAREQVPLLSSSPTSPTSDAPPSCHCVQVQRVRYLPGTSCPRSNLTSILSFMAVLGIEHRALCLLGKSFLHCSSTMPFTLKFLMLFFNIGNIR